MIRTLCVAVCATLFTGPGVAGEGGAQMYEEARRVYWRLIEDGAEGRAAPAWRRAADRFRRVTENAPHSGKADDALYMTGLCLEQAYALSAESSDREGTLNAYDRLSREYPRSTLADDALLRAGRILEARGDSIGAQRYYRQVLVDVPHGDMVELARRRLARLGDGTAVMGVRHWAGNHYTRVVVDLSDPGAFEARRLGADLDANRPERIYLDISRGTVAPDCPTGIPISDALVRQVRVGQYDRNTARVVLDLETSVTFRVFPLHAPARVVLDVFRAGRDRDLVGAIIRERRQRVPRSEGLRIVIDPGHGGKDPGAIGPGGLQEKNVVLALALELSRALVEQLACEIRLTRDRDVFLGLEERTAIANAFEADLFISLHANANRSPQASGAETYYLDRSSDRAARKLAAMENAGSEQSLAEVEHILTDMILTPKIHQSRALAEALQRSLVSHLSSRFGPVRDLGVKRGPFYVLTGAVMPAVLVETGFLTHPEESRRLADAEFRQHAALALALGVERFAKGG